MQLSPSVLLFLACTLPFIAYALGRALGYLVSDITTYEETRQWTKR